MAGFLHTSLVYVLREIGGRGVPTAKPTFWVLVSALIPLRASAGVATLSLARSNVLSCPSNPTFGVALFQNRTVTPQTIPAGTVINYTFSVPIVGLGLGVGLPPDTSVILTGNVASVTLPTATEIASGFALTVYAYIAPGLPDGTPVSYLVSTNPDGVLDLSASGNTEIAALTDQRTCTVAPPNVNTAEDLTSTCPTAQEVERINSDIKILIDSDPTAGTLVCKAAEGSVDLTRLQERTYQTLRLMRSIPYEAPFPWTSKPLYDWFVSAVRGIRYNATSAFSFCCDPPGYINISLQTWDFPATVETLTGLMSIFAHEARHNEGFGHTCGSFDQTISELGAIAVQYYLAEWSTFRTGDYFVAKSGDPGRYLSSFFQQAQLGGICNAERGVFEVPVALDLGSVDVGGAGIPGLVTVSLVRGEGREASILGISGTDAPNFQILSNTCSGFVPPSCTVQIRLQPVAPGPLHAQLDVLDVATGLISSVSLSGVGKPPGCVYIISPGAEGFPAEGGDGSVIVTAQNGCVWTATAAPTWVSFTSSLSGEGAGSVTYRISSNFGSWRSATLTVAGLSFTIEQQAASIPGLSFLGSMPHIAAEENWTTTFTLINKGAASAQARLSLFGDPSGSLALPLAFPQQPSVAGPLLAASFDRVLAANAALIVNTAGPQTPPVLVGSAQLAGTGSVDGFAVFHQIVTAQEAVVPMETRNAGSYLLAFDNTNGLVLGVALENVSASSAVIPVVIRDENGVVISAPGASISLGDNAHTSFVLSDPVNGFPVTAEIRGTIEFYTPPAGRISVLGIRFTPPNNALTTIPALANVGTGGGSIAHLASGGDGWQTTFVLVNTGTSATPFTLSFFADQTGGPMSLPLSFPQSNGGSPTVTASVTQNLAAGATRVIVSSGAADLLTGSAQLSTAGHISGFVIFRHNNQEAVVPLESRNAGGYIIAFDNTNGAATGIAVNGVSAGHVIIPVTVRDASGVIIATDTLTLSANGHLAFTLGIDKYPGTANIRGTIEFDTPAGAQIGALGIRIPIAHTFTTLPALTK